MAWLSLTFLTDAAHAEPVCDALLEAGALSATIEDAEAGTANETPQFGEPGSPATPGWALSSIQALIDRHEDPARLLAEACAASGLAEVPPYTVLPVAEENWVQLTQAQFDPIRVSQRLWIVPTWHQAPDPQALNLILDPGMAFGTGSHPTTRLCLEWLERELTPGCSLLDYGCGSGILAIAGALLGAEAVMGVDIDPQAVDAAQANALQNQADCRFALSTAPLDGVYDLVLANILANPLKMLAPAICRHIAPAGRLALSGILVEQADELIALYAPFLPLQVVDTREGWVCLAGRRD